MISVNVTEEMAPVIWNPGDVELLFACVGARPPVLKGQEFDLEYRGCAIGKAVVFELAAPGKCCGGWHLFWKPVTFRAYH